MQGRPRPERYMFTAYRALRKQTSYGGDTRDQPAPHELNRNTNDFNGHHVMKMRHRYASARRAEAEDTSAHTVSWDSHPGVILHSGMCAWGTGTPQALSVSGTARRIVALSSISPCFHTSHHITSLSRWTCNIRYIGIKTAFRLLVGCLG